MLIDQHLFDTLLQAAADSPRLRASHDLRTTFADHSQRVLNALQPGTSVPIHRHSATAETVLVLRGRLTEIFYDDAGQETARHRLDPARGLYGVQIPAGTWHTVLVEEPCVIVEVKDGAYEPLRPEDTLNIP